jgi:NAD(P)-dependent dehydrogenase (short-subunit alcohol dehydrogenase family)
LQRKILVTGSTDGIGLEAARMLVSLGHHVLLHGRNPSKLKETERELSAQPGGARLERHVADLSLMAYGKAGGDIRIGAEILSRAALADEFASASGQYFDNDSGQSASPHPDALDPMKSQEIVRVIETVLAESKH